MLCRKPVWAKLKSEAYQGLTGKLFTPLPTRDAQACLQSRSLGIAKLRLLPKLTGSHCRSSCSNMLLMPLSCTRLYLQTVHAYIQLALWVALKPALQDSFCF